MTAFDAWVAQEVDFLMWSFDDYWRGLQREEALTYTATRVDACQGVFDIYFDDKNLAFMPHGVSVSIH